MWLLVVISNSPNRISLIATPGAYFPLGSSLAGFSRYAIGPVHIGNSSFHAENKEQGRRGS